MTHSIAIAKMELSRFPMSDGLTYHAIEGIKQPDLPAKQGGRKTGRKLDVAMGRGDRARPIDPVERGEFPPPDGTTLHTVGFGFARPLARIRLAVRQSIVNLGCVKYPIPAPRLRSLEGWRR